MPGVTDVASHDSFQLNNEINLFELYNKQQNGDSPTAVALPADNDSAKNTTTSTADKGAATDKDGDQGAGDKPNADDDAAAKEAALQQLMTDASKNGGKTVDTASAAAAADDKDGDKGQKGKQGAADKPAPLTADSPLPVIRSHYTESGLLAKLEDDELGEDEEENMEKALTKTVESRLDEAVLDYFQEALKDDRKAKDAKALIAHLAKGGEVHNFVVARRHEAFNPDNLNSNDAAVKRSTGEAILRSYYESIKWSQDKIDKFITRLSAAGDDALIDQARDIYPDWKAAQEQQAALDDEKLTTQKKAEKEAALQLNQDIRGLVTANPEILGFKLGTKAAQDKVLDYMFKPTVEHNGKMVPKYYADRIQKQNTPQYQLMQAVLMMNDMKIDATSVNTKVTNRLADKLKEMNTSAVATSSQGTDNKDRTVEIDPWDFG